MTDYRFDRQCRTPSSEAYLIIGEGDRRVGHIDLHFTQNIVYGTLTVENDFSEEGILDLIEMLDDELVVSADVPREDFVVSVYKGHEAGIYSDDMFEQGNGNGSPNV
jgi:formylmethanofuran dehydrogenase subunit C